MFCNVVFFFFFFTNFGINENIMNLKISKIIPMETEKLIKQLYQQPIIWLKLNFFFYRRNY